ncbi:MAG: SPOR domain-containing protein [bacterium]
MSNQHDQHDDFGGFGEESDNQTFMHGKPKPSEPGNMGQQIGDEKKSSESTSGFIAYVQPDAAPEEEGTSLKRIGFIVAATVVALALLWFILPNSQKSGNEDIIVKNDTIDEIEEAQKRDQRILDETREQDSLARVQDYLARMQLAQGKNIGNNERAEDQQYEGSEAEEPVNEKAPVKKVAPPDPIPAKTYPEYNDKSQGNLSPSIQKDQQSAQNGKEVKAPNKVQPRVSPKPKEQIASIKKSSVSSTEKKTQKSVDKSREQVINETFENRKKEEKNKPSTVSKKTSTGAEYSVQVMASISKSEADAALRKLQSRGISSAFLSQRSLKGKTWYRVRFGGFTERDQAQSAARKAGYSNAWVERIK